MAPASAPNWPGRPEFGDVEIDFQDPPLRQHQIDPHRQRNLQRLADHAAARPQEQVLRHLLGDGRAAARHLAVLGIIDHVAQRVPVDAVVTAEFGVLGGDHRARQSGRHRRRNRSTAATPARRSASARPSAPRPDGRRDRTAPADTAAAPRPAKSATGQGWLAASDLETFHAGQPRRAALVANLDIENDTSGHRKLPLAHPIMAGRLGAMRAELTKPVPSTIVPPEPIWSYS